MPIVKLETTTRKRFDSSVRRTTRNRFDPISSINFHPFPRGLLENINEILNANGFDIFVIGVERVSINQTSRRQNWLYPIGHVLRPRVYDSVSSAGNLSNCKEREREREVKASRSICIQMTLIRVASTRNQSLTFVRIRVVKLADAWIPRFFTGVRSRVPLISRDTTRERFICLYRVSSHDRRCGAARDFNKLN